MSDTDRFPKRIYVTNESGQPMDSTIYDADTHELVGGVFAVHVERTEITVVATLNWPIKDEDQVIFDPAWPNYLGAQRQGIKTITRTYHVKRLELESW